MIHVRELTAWLDTLNPDAFVGVNEGGLTLTTPGGDAYLEVGGIPFDEGGDDEGERAAMDRLRGDDDGVEYADPRDERDERTER